MGVLGVTVASVAVLATVMLLSTWIESRMDGTPESTERKPMSSSSRSLLRNAAWLLCAGLIGGLVGGAVASREPKVVSHEYDGDASDISKLESEISSLRSRVADLESKIER